MANTIIQPFLNATQIAPPAVAISPFVRKTPRKFNISKADVGPVIGDSGVRATFEDSESSTYAPESKAKRSEDHIDHIDIFA